MSVPDPPDRGYDERQARATLGELVGTSLTGIQIITLDELDTSPDGRDFQADLAIELSLDRQGSEEVALFHWGVNFGNEQLCIWQQPLRAVWPVHADAATYDLAPSWSGWPRGLLTEVRAGKLRTSEVGINQAELRFAHGGFLIAIGGLSGHEVDALRISPLAGQ